MYAFDIRIIHFRNEIIYSLKILDSLFFYIIPLNFINHYYIYILLFNSDIK